MPSSSISSELTRILLVDDNEAMVARAKATLTPGCVIVGSARDGQMAFDAALALRPDVIVLDISMPGMTGLELARRLRQVGSTAALVFLTVHDEADFVLAAKAVGGIGYVLKARLASDLPLAVQAARAGREFTSQIR
jgi:DNA-binding NarL/FixJ family response regulator